MQTHIDHLSGKVVSVPTRDTAVEMYRHILFIYSTTLYNRAANLIFIKNIKVYVNTKYVHKINAA